MEEEDARRESEAKYAVDEEGVPDVAPDDYPQDGDPEDVKQAEVHGSADQNA